MEKRLLSTFFFVSFLAQFTFAQNFDNLKLDRYFDVLEGNNKFMGSIAVSQNGKIIYARSLGFSDLVNKIKADEHTKYRIGSISKSFTAVLLLKAVEENRLALNQTIDLFFPTIKNSDKITINQLLSNRSGIPDFVESKDYQTWNIHPKSEKEMVAIIANAGSDFEPGGKFAYSNSNFVLLTYILQKTFKKTYSELLTKYITQPVGLRNTSLGTKINTEKKDAKSYRFSDHWEIQAETDPSIPLGAGGIVSTPSDLVKFSDALFGGKLLKKESLEQMKPIERAYGFGLFLMPFYDRIGYGHTGQIDGFSSVFCHFPDGGISCAITSNGSNFNTNDITIAVLSAVYGRPFDIPDFSICQVDPVQLDTYVGVYSSKQLPLKITITKEGTLLKAQATGQAAFPLEATQKEKFKYAPAGIVLEFNSAEKTMVLKQGGGEFAFTKD